MNTRQPGTGSAGRHFDRGRERHGGSRAGGQNAARLSHRGDRGDQPCRLSELRRKGSGNAGAFQGSFHYVVRGGKTQALEGQPPKSIVVLAFDITEKALAWYNSPAYEAIKPIRQGASVSRIFMAEGLPPQ